MIRTRTGRAEILCLFGLITAGGLMVAVPTVAQETGQMREAQFFSSTLDRKFDYLLYLPPDLRLAAGGISVAVGSANAPRTGEAGQGARYPVLYLLHGRGDSMMDWRRVGPVLDELIRNEVIPPVIAVAPDAPGSERGGYYIDSTFDSPDADAVETAIISDLLPHVDASFPTIGGRHGRILVGYSMGGYGAIRYALAHADRFGGAIVLSPAVYTPLPPAESSTREFGAFGAGPQRFSAERYRELNYPSLLEAFPGGRAPLRFFVAVGDDEWRHPDPKEMMHDLDMEAHLFYTRASRISGIDAEFRVYDGGHDWDVWERGLREGLRRFATDLRMAPFRNTGSNAPAKPRTES